MTNEIELKELPARPVATIRMTVEPSAIGKAFADLLPQVMTVGMILNPKNSDAEEVTQGAQEGARALGRELIVAGASSPEQLDEAFARVVERSHQLIDLVE